jgi:voltage-gated potassium channel
MLISPGYRADASWPQTWEFTIRWRSRQMTWRFTKTQILIFGLVSFFCVLVIPVAVATDLHEVGPVGGIFAALMFIMLWLLICAYTMQAVVKFYNVKVPPWLADISPIQEDMEGLLVIIVMLLGYFFTIYAFGVAYIFMSAVDQNAFSSARTLSLIDGMYFSVVTAATVGYGDIVPVSNPARIGVIIEIILSLLYVVFLFSVASSYGRESNKKPQLDRMARRPTRWTRRATRAPHSTSRDFRTRPNVR